jgi:FAD synthetase
MEELASKYIASAEQAFKEIEIVETSLSLDHNSVNKVIESARAYLEDAKYYRDRKKFEVSLASIAYCEGLLDALKLLGAVRFEWPTTKEKKKEK